MSFLSITKNENSQLPTIQANVNDSNKAAFWKSARSCLARAISKGGRQAAGCVPYLVDKLPHNYSSRVMNHAF